MWPTRWLTGIRGLPQAIERVLAVVTPTTREPINPGPTVTAKASIEAMASSLPGQPVFPQYSSIVLSNTGKMNSSCFLEATSGTTPPVFSWNSLEVATTDTSSLVPSSTIVQAVSSQEVSMANIFMGKEYLKTSLIQTSKRNYLGETILAFAALSAVSLAIFMSSWAVSTEFTASLSALT